MQPLTKRRLLYSEEIVSIDFQIGYFGKGLVTLEFENNISVLNEIGNSKNDKKYYI